MRAIDVGPLYGIQACVTYVKRQRAVRLSLRMRGVDGPDEELDGGKLALGDFLRALGITGADCRRALARDRAA